MAVPPELEELDELDELPLFDPDETDPADPEFSKLVEKLSAGGGATAELIVWLVSVIVLTTTEGGLGGAILALLPEVALASAGGGGCATAEVQVLTVSVTVIVIVIT